LEGLSEDPSFGIYSAQAHAPLLRCADKLAMSSIVVPGWKIAPRNLFQAINILVGNNSAYDGQLRRPSCSASASPSSADTMAL